VNFVYKFYVNLPAGASLRGHVILNSRAQLKRAKALKKHVRALAVNCMRISGAKSIVD
jgi:hypothetical protein